MARENSIFPEWLVGHHLGLTLDGREQALLDVRRANAAATSTAPLPPERYEDLAWLGLPAARLHSLNDPETVAKMVEDLGPDGGRKMMGGLIVREYNDAPSNFRTVKTVGDLLEENGIPGIEGVDTRRITRIIRSEGSQKVLLCDAGLPQQEAIQILKDTQLARDVVPQVSCKKRWYSRTASPRFNVVAVDCGMKLNIVRRLSSHGCNITVVPYNTTAQEVLALRPDGLFLSNGPGDPEDVPQVIELVRALRGRLPIFGKPNVTV